MTARRPGAGRGALAVLGAAVGLVACATAPVPRSSAPDDGIRAAFTSPARTVDAGARTSGLAAASSASTASGRPGSSARAGRTLSGPPRSSPTPVEGSRPTRTEWPRPESPWWADVQPGAYRIEGASLTAGRWRIAVGRSRGHHHVAEGLLDARVEARLALERALEAPMLELLDVFVAPDRSVFVLYGARLPEGPAPALRPPPDFERVPHGRHAFERARHLFMECAVEGPLLNPEWGATRYTAFAPEESP